MTVGIGRKFGKRIVLSTDTMITDSNKGKTDPIPGRLKGIILNPTASIAYAGHSDPAIDAIANARINLLRTGDVLQAATPLIAASERTDIDVDFILAYHIEGRPFMHKITSNGMSDDLDTCFIGDPLVFQIVLELASTQESKAPPGLGIQDEEVRFHNAFDELFTEQGTHLNRNVGGLPISVVASPFGHYYPGKALSKCWDIDLRFGITPDQHARQRAGETSWQYSLVGGNLRGVPVLGLTIPQAGTAYIYAPLMFDDAERIRTGVPNKPGFIDSVPLIDAARARVNELSNRDGAGVIELPATCEQSDSADYSC